MAASPQLGTNPESPESVEPVDSWTGKTFMPIEELAARTPPITLQPARIISVGPAAPEPAERVVVTPPPAARSPYAVDDNEQTLFDHHQPEHQEDEAPPVELQSAQMVALRPPLHAPMAVTVESRPPPADTPQLRDPRLVLLLDPDSQRSASFRLLRDNVLSRPATRIIAVSSGAPHEGKTTCAINLALALSEQPSARVLLLEGNFFAPSLGSIFGIDRDTRPAPQMNLPWLTPYRIVEVMRGFHVAALVQEDGEPAAFFNSRWFDMVLGHLSGAAYDHFVIDSAALDGSPAVTQIVGAADGTLLTVRSGGTTVRTFRRASELIPKGRALGVVLMDGDT